MLTPKEEKILYALEQQSERFETPLRVIHLPSLGEVYIKDESVNPTGTHKDRMAYEILNVYKNFLRTKKHNSSPFALPHLSLLSSGAAAIAIQIALKKYELPHLKVLIDEHTSPSIVSRLREIGCEVYTILFDSKELSGEEILHLTNNKDGIDVTSCSAFDTSSTFYHSLVEEIIHANISFDFIFMPFGSGHLYETFMNFSKEKSNTFSWLSNCNFMGAEIKNPSSKAHQLFSPFRPFGNYSTQWQKMFVLQGYCGMQSGVYGVNEERLLEAIQLLELKKIRASPESCTSLALYLQLRESISPNKKVLIINTGKVCM